jgi:predicted O-methyltransferase YrrM
MSKTGSPVGPAHFDWLRRQNRPEDPFLRDLRLAAAQVGLPEIHIAWEQVLLFEVLLGLCGATRVVEVGTLGGYSAIAMARALPEGGRVVTVELDAAHAAFARQWIAKSDVAERIEVIVGAGARVLPGLAAASFDAAFIDADKQGYPGYLRECLRLLRRGGLFLADNALAFGRLLDVGAGQDDPGVAGIRAFHRVMAEAASRGELRFAVVPLGDGCWVAQKA